MQPLISVIVAVYNVEPYLDKCIQSILNQTYPNLEIILVDDGSSDNCPSICDKYAKQDRRIKVIHKKNEGVSRARNAGLAIATGEYVGFVDGDDWIELDMYAYLLDLCQQNLTEISCCEYMNENPHRTFCFTSVKIPTCQWLSCQFSIASVCVKLFSRNLLHSLSFNTQVTMGEDGLFSTQALCNTDFIAYGKRAKYHYRLNIQGATKSIFQSHKLSYFTAIQLEQACIQQKGWKKVLRKIQREAAYTATGFLKQIIVINFTDKVIIEQLRNILKKHIWIYLLSPYKLTNRLFALACCINFNLAARIYRSLFFK